MEKPKRTFWPTQYIQDLIADRYIDFNNQQKRHKCLGEVTCWLTFPLRCAKQYWAPLLPPALLLSSHLVLLWHQLHAGVPHRILPRYTVYSSLASLRMWDAKGAQPARRNMLPGSAASYCLLWSECLCSSQIHMLKS